MKTECVKCFSSCMKSCTYVRILSTYKRIVVRMYVYLYQQSSSLSTHRVENPSTYRLTSNGAEA